MEHCNILKINDEEELVTVSRMFGYRGIDLQDKCWILLGKRQRCLFLHVVSLAITYLHFAFMFLAPLRG